MLIAATHKEFCVTKPPAGMRANSAISLALPLFLAVMAGLETAAAAESDAPTSAIVVTIPLAAPESTERDVASQHGLEPVERHNSRVLEQRIIVYRIPGGRAAADVLRQVRADARVSSVQPNFQYTPPPVRMPDSVIAGRPRDGTSSAKPNARPPPRQARSSRIAAGPQRRAWRRRPRRGRCRERAPHRLHRDRGPRPWVAISPGQPRTSLSWERRAADSKSHRHLAEGPDVRVTNSIPGPARQPSISGHSVGVSYA